MFSGKSSHLIHEGLRKKSVLTNKSDVIMINHALDIRCGDGLLQSHNKVTIPAIKVSLLADLLRDHKEEYTLAKMILIDEGQFYDDLVPFTLAACAEDKYIIIASLDGDIFQNPFGHVLELIPHADKVLKLYAYCKICADGKTRAPFTTMGAVPAPITPQRGADSENENGIGKPKNYVEIGAGEKYISVCRNHLNSFNKK
jgi:thymidine kinase